MLNLKRHLMLFFLGLAILTGALLSYRQVAKGGAESPGQRPNFRLYTNPGATTAQLPFWSAAHQGKIAPLFDFHTEYWKESGEFQALLLAGKGDLWIGPVEAFARAKQRGAPISLLAITGWRKFCVVSLNPKRRSLRDFYGEELPFAPNGSPGVPILQALLGTDRDQIRLQPYDPKQLALMLLRGKLDSALVPEPLVTILLQKLPELKIVLHLEDLYALRNNCEARIPLAGLAINTTTVGRHPQLVEDLLQALLLQSAELNRDKSRALEVLPAEFARFIPPQIVAKSLERDLILALPARDVQSEVAAYLKLVTPDLLIPDAAFFWRY
jgi:NitT/TauT family transport system substrate-binding protein